MGKVMIVWQSDYPWDVRIDKFVRTFISNNIKVIVLANNKKNIETEYYFGAKIIRPDSYLKVLPFSKAWVKLLSSSIRNEKPDFIIVRDLPLFFNVYIIATKKHIPIWFDMAEDYPATFLDMKRSIIEKILIRNYCLSRIYEYFALANSEVISVVCEESKQRLEKINKKFKDKVFVLENFPDKYFLTKSVNHEMKSKNNNDTIKLIYTGNISPKRGLEVAINAINILKKKWGDKVKLIIVGSPKNELDRLNQIVRSLHISNNIELKHLVPYEELSSLIASADIGIVPHINTLHTRTTLPNKLYDYFAVGKPVIVSDVNPLKRVLEETQTGYVYSAGDPVSMCNAIEKFLVDKKLIEEMGRKAYESYVKKFNWEAQTDKILYLTKRLLSFH